MYKELCNLCAIGRWSEIVGFSAVFFSRGSGKTGNCVISAEKNSDRHRKEWPITPRKLRGSRFANRIIHAHMRQANAVNNPFVVIATTLLLLRALDSGIHGVDHRQFSRAERMRFDQGKLR